MKNEGFGNASNGPDQAMNQSPVSNKTAAIIKRKRATAPNLNAPARRAIQEVYSVCVKKTLCWLIESLRHIKGFKELRVGGRMVSASLAIETADHAGDMS